MPEKKSATTKIIDVSAPDQISPNPTSRPVVVTNRPVLTNDPMMVGKNATDDVAGLPTAPAVSRQAKTISPIVADAPADTPPKAKEDSETGNSGAAPKQSPDANPTQVADTDAAEGPTDNPAAVAPESVSEAPALDTKQSNPSDAPESPPAPQPTETVSADEPEVTETSPAPSEEQVAATKTASDEKQLELDAARHEELEALITSGKYAVPINAVQRKRTKMIVIGLSVLAVVLALVLLDLALDSHALTISGLPHTNFFQAK